MSVSEVYTYPILTAGVTVDRNALASNALEIDELVAEAEPVKENKAVEKSPSSGLFAVVSRWQVTRENANDRMGLGFGCSTREDQPNNNFVPIGDGGTFYDSGAPRYDIHSLLDISLTIMNGPYLVEGNWTAFGKVTGGENLQNTPLKICYALDNRLIDLPPGTTWAWPEHPVWGGLLNLAPAQPEAGLFCFKTDEFGNPVDENGDIIFNPADYIPAPGFEGYPFAFCPYNDARHIRNLYVGKINVQLYETREDLENNGTPTFDETYTYSTMENISAPGEENGYPLLFPAMYTYDASDWTGANAENAIPAYECVDLPLESNNTDGSFVGKIAFKPIVDLTGYPFPTEDASAVVENAVSIWLDKQEGQ